MNDPVKTGILELTKSIWTSFKFRLVDTERTRRLREEIIERTLSAVMTDDERAELLGLPEGCRIRESAKIISKENFKCGTHVWIGENVILDASGDLCIGDHTTLGVGTLIWTHESALANIMLNNRSGNPWIVRKPTRIGSGCYIGGPSSIYPGVSIGDKVIVLPMSVVTGDVPSNVMIGGSPARIIRKIDDAWIARYRERNGIATDGGNA